jgi:hypothetical protein
MNAPKGDAYVTFTKPNLPVKGNNEQHFALFIAIIESVYKKERVLTDSSVSTLNEK